MQILKAVAASTAIMLLAVAAPSPAAATGTMGGPGAVLTLSWSAPGVSHQVFTTTLTCSPTSSNPTELVDADAACADLSSAAGDFDAVRGWWWLNCTTYQGWAIRTTAEGHWFGQPVYHDVLHANICEARKATGAIFNF